MLLTWGNLLGLSLRPCVSYKQYTCRCCMSTLEIQPLSNSTASYQRAHLHIVSALACHAQSGCSTRTSGTVAEEGCTPA